MEIWKEIKGFDSTYKISNKGRVISCARNKETLLSLSKNSTGYYRVVFYKDKKQKAMLVHRLVALYFIDNPNNHTIVDHIDGNKLNNNVENLRWVTQKDNIFNDVTYKIYKDNFKKYNKEKLKPVYQLDNNNKIIKKFNSVEEAAKELDCDVTSIRRSCKIAKYKTKGYYWTYYPFNLKIKV